MYQAAKDRYDKMEYKRCGESGIMLPRVSLGLWQNFGMEKPLDEQRDILLKAFDLGVTHFDLANNYGAPAAGKAEVNFGTILKSDLGRYRDELLISTKAGFDMWPGPYGNWGSRKYLTASLDQSLKRLGIPYVDIFYHHRPDPNTPLFETMGTLADFVKQGKALYVGISNYSKDEAVEAVKVLNDMGVHCLIEQPRYNMFERTPEEGLFPAMEELGVGSICYSPLAQGALTDRYLKGIPSDSRAAREGTTLKERYLKGNLDQIKKLNKLAGKRGQTLAQMALSWVLRQSAVTSVVIGASSIKQLEDNIACLGNLDFTQEELNEVDAILK